jgi:hypothetical protein
MSLRKSLLSVLKENSLQKKEDPHAYAKLANEGLLLGYPVKINGSQHRPDNGIKYHSSIKFFNNEKDDPKEVHKIASKMGPHKPHSEEIGITPDKIKSRAGDDIYVIKLHGHHADQIKDRHKQFGHMGHKENYEFHPHISVDKQTHDRIKASGAKTAHEAGIEFGHPELKRGPKTIHSYEPKVKKSEQPEVPPLTKPYSSEAQRRWAHTEAGKKALGGEAAVHEWDEATKGKRLPEKIGKTEELEKGIKGDWQKEGYKITHKWVDKHGNLSDQGHINTHTPVVYAETKNREHAGIVQTDKHPKGGVKINYTEVEPAHRRKGLASGMYSYLEKLTGQKLERPSSQTPAAQNLWGQKKRPFGKTEEPEKVGKSELEKGAVKNALTGIAMGVALASPSATDANQSKQPARSPASISAPKSDYSREKVLNAISQVESSGGKNTHHKPTSMGTAYGRWAVMPDMVHDTIRLNPDLKRQHKKAMALNGKDLHHYLQDNPKLEQEIVNRHLSRLEHHFGQDPNKISYAWNHGIIGTNRALKEKQDISSHPYVQKFKQAYQGSK